MGNTVQTVTTGTSYNRRIKAPSTSYLSRVTTRGFALLALLTLAACRPRASRLLLVDYTLGDPIDLQATALPWHDAGYTVEYRRFFPHLTRDDLRRYHGVVVLGGMRPDAPSDALTTGDAVLLTEWVRAGGVVVLGYPAGALDRWTMNRWLASLGAGLEITDSAPSPARSAMPIRRTLPSVDLLPVELADTRTIRVRLPAQALARVRPATRGAPTGPAIIAAVRVAQGLVVVTSREALAVEDTGATKDFFETVARWTRRPAEWANVPAAIAPSPLSLEGGPESLRSRLPLATPPGGSRPVTLPLHVDPHPNADSVTSPEWTGHAGLRVLWAEAPGFRAGYLERKTALDSLTSLLDVGALNVFAGPVNVEAMAESTHYAPWERTVTQNVWKVMGDRLEQTSARWVPALEPDSFRLPPDTTGVAAGRCLLDPGYWNAALVPGMISLARLAAQHQDLIPAVAIDLEREPSSTQPAATICEADFDAGIDAMVKDSAVTAGEAADLKKVAPQDRYDVLLNEGLVDDLFEALERVTTTRASDLRNRLLRIRPGLMLAVRAAAPPQDWFGRGLLRGWSSPAVPVILLTRDPSSRQTNRRYRGRGINVLTAFQLVPQGIAPAAWAGLRPLAFRENDGFWLDARRSGISPGNDSTWRLVRRLVPEK
ncbi:MAG TPA: hypothetical protein VJN62_14550 [Gemmatimonadales bacterium]|nr:hypothetical protein [Gemmatimonadales bacterium]